MPFFWDAGLHEKSVCGLEQEKLHGVRFFFLIHWVALKKKGVCRSQQNKFAGSAFWFQATNANNSTRL